jgi:hypothetical protein
MQARKLTFGCSARGKLSATTRKSLMINLRAIPIVFCVGVLIAFNGIAGELQRSLDDYDARREFDLASSAITKIHSVLESEMKRVMFRQPGPQSPDVQKYIHNENFPPIKISDLHVPLHLRLIERERQEAVAAIGVAKSSVELVCEDTSFNQPDQFLDPDTRQRVLNSLRCHRENLKRYQTGQHKLLKMHEASALELHLPPYTENEELTKSRDWTARQDAELESAYAKQRKGMQATENFVLFLDAHAATMHFTAGRLLFDDPTDATTAQDLINQVSQLNP